MVLSRRHAAIRHDVQRSHVGDEIGSPPALQMQTHLRIASEWVQTLFVPPLPRLLTILLTPARTSTLPNEQSPSRTPPS